MLVKVLIASPLHSYTKAGEVDAEGDTVAEVLADLAGNPLSHGR